jgi:integrase/recombinase XerC
MGASNANNGPSDELDREGQLALFADVSAVPAPGGGVSSEARRNGSSDGELDARGSVTGAGGALPHADADRAELSALEEMLVAARVAGDERAPLEILTSSLADAAVAPRRAPTDEISVRRARDDWLRRLEASRKSESSLVAYRVAIDDLLDWSEPRHRSVFEEATIVDYLSAYQQRAHPAPATYYRRFLLLRRFLRWVSQRVGAPDPFRDLDPPPKPRQERDWLTREEFRRLLDAAGKPDRNLPGLAERDQLVLLTLVLTGLRRSELCALDWRDLDIDSRKPSLLVRSGKGGKSRRQPVPTGLARQLQLLANAQSPEPSDPVFCGLQGGRLQETILADIIRRAATRAGIEKHVTAHTLRHTAATWLRQERGDTRLVAEYLGHADLSTVARYAHVDREELFEAASRLEDLAVARAEPRAPPSVERAFDTAHSDQTSASDEATSTPATGRLRRRRRGRRRRR